MAVRYFNCGQGCGCTSDTCSGCIRAGGVCHTFPKNRTTRAGVEVESVNVAVRLAPTDIVTVDVDGVPLVEIAALLGKMVRDPIAVPADLAYSAMNVTLTDMSLNDVVTQLGLVGMPKRSI